MNPNVIHPTLRPGDYENLKTIVSAAKSDALGVIRVQIRDSDPPVYATLIAARNTLDNGDIELVPMARLFDGNPYELFVPPD